MLNCKQSAPDWCFYDGELKPEEYYRKLKAVGYTGVEMLQPEHRLPAKQAGLQIINIAATGMQKGQNDPANHPQLIASTIKTIEEAKRDEISHVIIFSGNNNGQEKAIGLQNCIAAIEQYLPVAEKNGIVLLFEMLNSFDHLDYQGDSSSYGFEIVKHFQSQNLKVLYDIYHMFRMGENVIADITENLDLIGHIHLAGSPTRNNPAFDNEIDYPAIFKSVITAGYTGFWGQEFQLTADRWDELKEAYNFLAGFYENIKQ